MYTRNTSNYEKSAPVGFVAYLNSSNYGAVSGSSVASRDYNSLISESKCRCRGTCRTGIGCTCK